MKTRVPSSPRTNRASSVLFALILCLSLALVVWWTIFQVSASGELEAAGSLLAAGDTEGAAQALGAANSARLAELAHTRVLMFASEGAVFAVVLLLSGWLYMASERRETSLRSAQDRFLAGATHELKTPLATIVLLLESLRDERLPADKRARYLTTGLLEAERLERGLTNVLIAAGLRTAAVPHHDQPGDLVQDVTAAITTMRARATAAGIEIATDLPATLPMSRNPEAVQIVLRNLLDNAVKYSPSGSTVTVTLTASDEEACVRVGDHGRGLDEQELDNAWKPFSRGSDTATGGTGLGLHLVRELVLAHGGSVTVDSRGRDHGAEFTIRLPRRGGGR